MTHREEQLEAEIANIEGEIMLSGFYGTSIEALKAHLISLYAEKAKFTKGEN